MLLGLALLYVGAVLVLNGIWLIDRISDQGDLGDQRLRPGA